MKIVLAGSALIASLSLAYMSYAPIHVSWTVNRLDDNSFILQKGNGITRFCWIEFDGSVNFNPQEYFFMSVRKDGKDARYVCR